MKNLAEQITELAGAYGFIEVKSKNPHMISFQKEEDTDCRINFYFTTGTLTVQYRSAKPSSVHRNITLEAFEDILQNI